MRCLVLADQDTEFVQKVCLVLGNCGAIPEVLDPESLVERIREELREELRSFAEKKPPKIFKPFTHAVIMQTECTQKQTELFGKALQQVEEAAILGLRVDWCSLAKGGNMDDLMVVPAMPHTKEMPIYHNGKGIFLDVDNPFLGKRHGIFAIALLDKFLHHFDVVANTSYGEVIAISQGMGFENRFLLNLHDEVLFGDIGRIIFKNFLSLKPNKPGLIGCNFGG